MRNEVWRGLTLKQRAFAKAWAETGVVAQAAERAGLDAKYAHELSKREEVQIAVDELLEKTVSAAAITAGDIQLALWKEGTTAESDTARVNALMGLAKIKGMLRGGATIDTITVIREAGNKILDMQIEEGETK
jgi:phage terminase small subunit